MKKIFVIPEMTVASVQAAINAIGPDYLDLEMLPGTYNWTSGVTFTSLLEVCLSGAGATVMCAGTDINSYFSPFTFQSCGKVSVFDIEIDYLNPPFAQGVCTAVDATTATFALDTSIGIPTWGDITTIHQIADANNGPVLVLTTGTAHKYPIVPNGDGTWTVSGLSVSPSTLQSMPVIGSRYAIIHRKFPKHAFNFLDTGDLWVERTKIRTCAGMAFYTNHVLRATYIDNEIMPPVGSTRWMSLMADCFHVDYPSDFVRVHNNRAMFMGDDGANVSNYVMDITAVTSPTVFTVAILPSSSDVKVIVASGDVLDFIDGTGVYKGSRSVVSATGGGTLVRNITIAAYTGPGPDPLLSLDTSWGAFNTRYSARIDIRDNVIGLNAGRGAVTTGSSVTVQANDFYNCIYSGIAVGNLYLRLFNEGDYPNGTHVLNNVVDGCGIPNNSSLAVGIDAYMYDPHVGGTYAPATAAGGLVIAGNLLRNIPGCGIGLSGWTKAAITGNVFDNVCSAGYTGFGLKDAITLVNADVLTIDGNVTISGVGTIWPRTGGTVTNLTLGVNYGMTWTGTPIPSTTSAVKVTVISAPGTATFTRNPATVTLATFLGAAGSGGGSGALQNAGAACSGGGGGGAGGVSLQTWTGAQFGSSQTVIVGAGGAGGVAPTVGPAAGNPGSAGGTSSIDGLQTAVHGNAGAGGQLASNSGGGGGGGAGLGSATAGTSGAAGTGTAGSLNSGAYGASSVAVFSGGLGSGGGGGVNGFGGGLSGSVSAGTLPGPTGGGAGGGIDAINAPKLGGNSGFAITGISGGSSSSGGAVGSPGGNGPAPIGLYQPSCGGGGGGSDLVAAGKGGDGGRGAGGGGGGSAQTGGVAGDGGKGGDGWFVAIEYLSNPA